jgi:hypothetical protein
LNGFSCLGTGTNKCPAPVAWAQTFCINPSKGQFMRRGK